MPPPVVATAMLKCSFGLAPSPLIVVPDKRVMIGNIPAASILDNKPMLNVVPFGLCNSLMNPVTAAQTVAALGVLTPGMCTPVTTAPWAPGSSTVLLAGVPALTKTSMCMCAYGGMITIENPGTTNVMVA